MLPAESLSSMHARIAHSILSKRSVVLDHRAMCRRKLIADSQRSSAKQQFVSLKTNFEVIALKMTGFLPPRGLPNFVRRPRARAVCMTGAKPPDPDVAAYSISETFKDSPLLNSTLMNAMRDYFGDDGREVQDYMKRAVNENNEAMFRVVVIGSGPREVAAVEALSKSDVITGLYYCPDEDAVCDLEMSKFARSATVSAYVRQPDVVRFAKWCVADAVFVGPDREGCISRESEKELADAEITLFPHDVTAAIADGTLDVRECLAPLAQAEEEEERLVE